MAKIGASELGGELRARIIARKFVKDVGVLTAANIAVAALTLVQGIFVARWLGPELYGLVALIMVYPGLVHAVLDARSVSASTKYLGEYNASGDRHRAVAMCKLSFMIDLAISLLAFLILLATARVAAEHIVHHSALSGLMVLYGAALIPRTLVGTSQAILTTLGHFSRMAGLETAITSLRVVLVVGLVLGGWQVAGVIWASAAAALAAGLSYAFVACRLVRNSWGESVFHGSIKCLKGKWREIFSFLAYSDLATLIGIIPRHLDVLLLGFYRNPTEVGYYRLGKSLAYAVGYLTGPLKAVTYPELVRLWGRSQHAAFLRKVKNLAIWLGIPLALFVFFGVGSVSLMLPLLVGEEYRSAIYATQLLLVASGVTLVFYWVRLVYFTTNRVREYFILNAVVTLIFASFYPFVVVRWGFTGASAWMLLLNATSIACLGSWWWQQPRQEYRATYA